MYQIDFGILADNLGLIALGVKKTIFICALSLVFAFLFGSVLFWFRWGRNKMVSGITTGFVEFIRNTPLLIQLYIFYKGLPQINIVFNAEWCGIIALSIYTGVYISETLRAGANNVHSEQKSAAFSLGLNDIQTFCYVIYPQTVRSVIIPLGSQFINLIKNSTLVSFIAVTDIFYVVSQGISDYFRVIEFMVLGVALYAILTGFIVILSNILERQYKIRFSEAN